MTYRPPSPSISSLLVLAVVGTLLGLSVAAAAQDRNRGESAAPRVSDDDADEEVEVEDTREVVEGGSKIKVMEFTGLDISGRLKSPQLLYFLNRLRAEFDRPRLPHRSFMPELQRATKSRSFE